MVFEKVKALLAEQLGVESETITLESNIVAELHADSLDVVELLISLEDNFGIQVPDEVANTFVHVKDIVKFIEDNK